MLQGLKYGVHVFHVQCELIDLGASAAGQLRVGYGRWILLQHKIRRPDSVYSKGPPKAIGTSSRLRQTQNPAVEVDTGFQVRSGHGDVGEYSWQGYKDQYKHGLFKEEIQFYVVISDELLIQLQKR